MFPNITIYVQKHSFSNIYGLSFSLKIKSERINICTKFSNCRWMKMAKIDLPKRSGKRSKVREKSVKSQGILKTILSGNPVYVSYISNKPPLVGEHAFPLTEFVARRLTLRLNGINQVKYELHSIILI